MPHYRKHGKDFFPLSESDFIKGMKKGTFFKRDHKGFVALLYHTGIRKMEALRATKEQFKLEKGTIYFDVGPRLKRGLHTAPLNIPLRKPFADEIWWCVENTKPDRRVWPYSAKTGYNIVARVFKYPHHLRLTRITKLFRAGFTVDQVRSWTGHKTLTALTPYVGYSNVKKMGEVA